MKIDGACHCGKITYTAQIDPALVSICHCTDCQTLTGTAFRTAVPAAKNDFELTGGQPKIYVKTAESGAKRAQAFCGDCGTPLYACAVTDPQAYMVRVGSIRQRAQLRPQGQIWCRSALAWVLEPGAIAGMAKKQLG
ncbi:MAG: GFA family protein [Betaproteobacteria bacterium]|nr:GFA family protein [Betaproteobacteria bacterium]